MGNICCWKSTQAEATKEAETIQPCTESPGPITTTTLPCKRENPPFLSVMEREIALSCINLKYFPYNVLRTATNKFDNKNIVGEGGFGEVYKGWIDKHIIAAAKRGQGLRVAIKKLRKEGVQGHSEWMTELRLLSQFDHPNVVKLIGYCCEGEERMLVYEYMSRGNLESYLMREIGPGLSWRRRVKVALGAARGLDYLHTNAGNPVIHRDLKTSNILLDVDFNAKLSDLGLAKFGPLGDKTHVTTKVIGTRGYLAPEYFTSGHITLMTDVYSFGVVLLEIMSGSGAMKTFSNGDIGETTLWAKRYLTSKTNLLHIIDRRMRPRMEEAIQFADIILWCINIQPKNRPTMCQVVNALEKLHRNMKNFEVRSYEYTHTSQKSL